MLRDLGYATPHLEQLLKFAPDLHLVVRRASLPPGASTIPPDEAWRAELRESLTTTSWAEGPTPGCALATLEQKHACPGRFL
ncbi:MAG: hypothetical protein WCG52_10620 [bacterium]